MQASKAVRQLAKFTSYMLGRRPDEFGLVPDAEGFVKIKDFLKAICEEEGWRHVRRSHLNEMMLAFPGSSPIDIREDRIRSVERDFVPRTVQAEEFPKLLYTCIRTRAYPHVTEKGIQPTGTDEVILSPDRSMAERIGKRYDASPILLAVDVKRSVSAGAVFSRMGELLYLADRIPVGCFSGPPLPKPKAEPAKPAAPPPPELPPIPGSYRIDPETIRKRSLPKGRKKEIDWKKDRKRLREEKTGNRW